MSNLWVNIRFLFWHLQIEYGSYLPKFCFNKNAWNNWRKVIYKPLQVHEFDWEGRK